MGSEMCIRDSVYIKKSFNPDGLKLTEATTRFELVIRVLQTHALPLGYVALLLINDSKGI